jgi:selT/selW/selH-like putative selenoprotein
LLCRCRFIALADAIEAAFPNVVVEGNPDGPGRPGSFEVKGAAGQLLFTRLGSGGWPQPEVLVESIAAAAACSTGGEAAQQA